MYVPSKDRKGHKDSKCKGLSKSERLLSLWLQRQESSPKIEKSLLELEFEGEKQHTALDMIRVLVLVRALLPAVHSHLFLYLHMAEKEHMFAVTRLYKDTNLTMKVSA